MRQIRDYSDPRCKAWCIHCGTPISATISNMDHVPTKSLLSRSIRGAGRAFDIGEGNLADGIDSENDVSSSNDYLPQVQICRRCNLSFSADETYLLCVLHAVMCGSLTPDETAHPEAARTLRSNGHIVAALRNRAHAQPSLFGEQDQFTLFPDLERIKRVVIKNARGHASHETGTAPDGETQSTYRSHP